MVILVVLLIISIIIVLLFVYRHKAKKRTYISRPTRFEDGCLYYDELFEYQIPFEIDVAKPCERVYYTRRGREIKKVLVYEKFSLEISKFSLGKVEVLEIYHTHIVPQSVKVKLLGASKIERLKDGYRYITSSRFERERFIKTYRTREEIMSGAELTFSIYDRAYVVYSSEPIGVKSYDAYKNFPALNPPCVISTPDKRLDTFLNSWVWDILSERQDRDFDLALVVCAMKLCYTKEGVGEYLKFQIANPELDIKKRSVLIGLLCEHLSVNGSEILGEKIGGYTVFDYVIRHINRNSVRLGTEEEDTIKLFIVSVSKFINFVDSYDLKLKLCEVVDKLKERWGTKRVDEGYLELYFKKDERVEVRRAIKIMALSRRGLVSEEVMKSANPLYVGKSSTPFSQLGAGLLWRAVIHDVVGVRRNYDNLTFKPSFPGSWECVKLDCLTKTGVCKVEFKSAKNNLIKVDGVSFSGGVIPKALGKRGKIEVYFTK